MALEPAVRQQVFKSARLWAVAVICAAVGAYVVWRTDAVGPGILAFLAALAVFGIPLWIYERSRDDRGGPTRTPRR